MKRLLASLCTALIISTIPASAAPENADSATLKRIFTTYLEQRQTASQLAGQDLKLDGHVVVEPGDHYYAVTMPHISVYNKDGSYTDIGILAINAIPGDKKGEWRMTIAIPTPVIGYDAQKKIESRIDIGAQSLAGIWNESAQHFTKLDARYENVTIQRIQDGITVKIPKTSVLFDLSPDENAKTWSGPAKYTLQDISFSHSGDPNISRIGQINIDAFLHNYSPKDAQAYQEKLSKMKAPAADGTINEAHVLSLYNMVFDSLSTIWDGIDSSITASDISLHIPANANTAEKTITLAKAGLAFNAKGFRSNSVTLSNKIFYDGLELNPAPQSVVDALPTHFNFDLGISKLPVRDLVALGKSTLQGDGTAKTPAENAALMTMALQIMTNAGTSLDIRDTSIGNPLYSALLNGKVLADLDATMKAAGKITLTIGGLDQVMATAKKQSQDKSIDTASRKKLQDMMVSLTVLQAIGQKQKNDNGKKDIRNYDLELTKDGKLTLNGIDLSAIQAMMGAANKAKNSDQNATPPAPQ